MSWLTVLQPVHLVLLIWIGLCLALLAGYALRDRVRAGRERFQDTEAYMLGAEAWCATFPQAPPPLTTAAPTPGIPLARRRQIDALARAAARQDFIDNGRRRANPYVRHSREFACWAIAYGEAWTGYELAAHSCTDPLRTAPDRAA